MISTTSFDIDYEDSPFLRTSKTAAHSNRLNWRCEILLTRNKERIEGQRVLDLASHDGRFSYACLKLGATHVTGVEVRHHLVEFATRNLISLACPPQQFDFLEANVFDYLPSVTPGEFDTIICFGFFYHTTKQVDLMCEINRIQPKCFILDTAIARNVYAFDWQDSRIRYASIRWMARLLQRMRIPTSVLRRIAPITVSRLEEEKRFVPCLVFKSESPLWASTTIDPLGLVAWPTQAFIELLLRTYGFNFEQLSWSSKEISDWTAIDDYRRGARVSYLATRRG